MGSPHETREGSGSSDELCLKRKRVMGYDCISGTGEIDDPMDVNIKDV